MLLKEGLSIAGLAEEFGCRREELSMCIRGVRVYPSLRAKLAKRLCRSEQWLFGARREPAQHQTAA